jgi:hypothetical protein
MFTEATKSTSSVRGCSSASAAIGKELCSVATRTIASITGCMSIEALSACAIWYIEESCASRRSAAS